MAEIDSANQNNRSDNYRSNRDRLKEITDSIETGIQELFQSEHYAQYLQTMSRFHRYSVNNQVLIHMQKPNATLVAGFNKWKNQFGRNVMRGERGIRIIAPTPYNKKVSREKLDPDTHLPVLDDKGQTVMEEMTVRVPMFRAVTVFDVSQTEGRPLPKLAHDLSGNVEHYDVFMEALKRSSPVPLSVEEIQSGMDGYFDPEHMRIALRDGMSEVQTVSAAIHEMAHALLHNRNKVKDGIGEKEQQSDITRNSEEVQAESISYAVCAYFGIATGENSFGYIASWSKDKTLPELRESLEIINNTAGGLIDTIDHHYAEIMKERETELLAAESVQAADNTAIAIEPPIQEQPQVVQDVLPDPAVSVEALQAYGYTDDSMVPLTRNRAMEFFERDIPVFLLFKNNKEQMAFSANEILNHGGLFGIDRSEWEAVKSQYPFVTENKWQNQFLKDKSDGYCVYQLRDDRDTAGILYLNRNRLHTIGRDVEYDNYAAVYSGTLSEDESLMKNLDDIYMRFNVDKPQNYEGRSLSVSDIIAIKRDGVVSCHYVDSVGFSDIPKFIPENRLKNAEVSVEDDYGMIDGIINNGAKEQPEIRAKAANTPNLSALFEAANRVISEDKPEHEDGRKASVLAKLQTPTPPRNDRTAQKKSAERDLI